MTPPSKYFLTVSLLILRVLGKKYYQYEYGDEQQQLCHSFNIDQSLISYPISRNLQPRITVSLFDDTTVIYNESLSFDVYIVSSNELQNKKERNLRKWCWFYNSYACGPITREEQDELQDEFHYDVGANETLVDLDDLISYQKNEFPAVHYELFPFIELYHSSAKERKSFSYDIAKSGIYCTIFRFKGGPSKVNTEGLSPLRKLNLRKKYQDVNNVSIKGEQVHGELLPNDYSYLKINFYSWLGYWVLSLIFGFYIYRENNSIYNTSLIIQCKILVYLFGLSIVYFFQYLLLRSKNIYGYSKPWFVESTIETLVTLITVSFNTWAIYNFLLLSGGLLFFNGNKKILKVISFVTAAYFIQNIILAFKICGFHYNQTMEMIHFLSNNLIFLLGSYWAMHTYRQLTSSNNQITRKFLATYVLMVSMHSTIFIMFLNNRNFEIAKMINENVSSVLMNHQADLSYLSDFCYFIVTVLIAIIWRNFRVSNNENRFTKDC